MTTHLAPLAVIALLLSACASNGQSDPGMARAMNAIGAALLGQQVRRSNEFMAKPVEPAQKQTFCKPIQGGYLYCW